MSYQSQADDSSSYSRTARPRSNTNPLLNWGRSRAHQSQVTDSSSSIYSVHSSAASSISPSTPASQPLPVEVLIETLSQPQVPILGYAKSLASALSSYSPLPHHQKVLNIAIRLFAQDSFQYQAVGFDIIAAFWESSEAPHRELGTADRMTFFSLFEDSNVPWAPDLWESRFKAFRAFTGQGRNVNGLEIEFLRIITGWIEETFNGLLSLSREADTGETVPSERANVSERERCLEILSQFLISCTAENTRLKEITGTRLLDYYVSLLNRAIDVAPPPSAHPISSPPERNAVYFDSIHSTPSSSRTSHRRNHSSLSNLSIPSPSTPATHLHGSTSLPMSPFYLTSKAPQERAIQMYLDTLRPQLRSLYPSTLNEIMPVLFRSMSYAMWPLQRLNVQDRSRDYRSTLEAKIMDVVHDLLAGPYNPAVMQLIKRALYAPIPPESPAIESASTADFRSGNRSPSLLILAAIQKSHGAFRVLRSLTRRALSTRMARAYIGREVSGSYSYAGAPTRLDLDRSQDVEQELIERAWGINATSTGKVGWDAAAVGKAMKEGVRSWVEFEAARHTQHMVIVGNGNSDSNRITTMRERIERARERVLEEAASIVRDVFHELDDRDDSSGSGGTSTPSPHGKAKLDPDEAIAIGGTLNELAQWFRVVSPPSLTPHVQYTLPLGQPSSAPTHLLRTIATLLARDHTTNLTPPLSSILWGISDHLSDEDSAKLPAAMMRQRELEPVTVGWIANWRKLLLESPSCGASSHPGVPTFICPALKPLTLKALFSSVEIVYDNIKDIRSCRRPLADILLEYSRITHEVGPRECLQPTNDLNLLTHWNLLAEEIVMRQLEYLEDVDANELDDEAKVEEQKEINDALEMMFEIAKEEAIAEDAESVEMDSSNIDTLLQLSQSLPPASASTSTFDVVASPIFSRKATNTSPLPAKDKDAKESGLLSLLSSFTGVKTPASSSPSPAPLPQTPSDALQHSISTLHSVKDPLLPIVTRQMGAVAALAHVFSSLGFTPSSLDMRNVELVLHVFRMLCRLASPVVIAEDGSTVRTSVSPQARLTALQFLMRIRADRDHHLYWIHQRYDEDHSVFNLGSLIGREPSTGASPDLDSDSPAFPSSPDTSRVRSKPQPDRPGRRATRGPRGPATPSTTSRSRSRIGGGIRAPVVVQKPRDPLWILPEIHPFSLVNADIPSEGLTSYDPNLPTHLVLPISDYLELLRSIMENEYDWEIMSYMLCHFPIQLANKHLFCGPICRGEISLILNFLCPALYHGELGSKIERWPPGLKARDAQGLGYHTVSVLISYKKYFDLSQKNSIVQVLHLGLNAHPMTIKCCLHALSVAAFELQPSMTKYMSDILQKLSEIMSNAEMAVHILGFLAIVGSLRPLQANFTERDYKRVFGVALQYLQLHNTTSPAPGTSWALAQHVRILSYSIVYVWFLAIKIPDRARHIPYITRQLFLANEGKSDVDDATEVCFDWLARYTYGSADPRPANSTLSEVIVDRASASAENPIPEKAWMVGNAIQTVRTLPRHGWVEIVSRRPSGLTKFLTHVENVPLAGPGEVNPDLFSVPAATVMERLIPQTEGHDTPEVTQNPSPPILPRDQDVDDEDYLPPDTITGYVWSKTAPSQRRKEVAIDPSFFTLQLAPYPSSHLPPTNLVRRIPLPDPGTLQKFSANFDRLPVIDTHRIGILYVAPGQTKEAEILSNTYGSPFYTKFLEGLGRLINLRGQVDVYAGGLDPDEDGEYAYAWWDDIGQILFHTATLMPTNPEMDPHGNLKKRHIGNDLVRIVWNDSGVPYQFDTLATHFQFVNIIIEPHSLGSMAAFSSSAHEHEYFKLTVQRAEGTPEFVPVGDFKIISAENLPVMVRQLSLLADWFASVWVATKGGTERKEYRTNWMERLAAIRRFLKTMKLDVDDEVREGTGLVGQETLRDFTNVF